MPQLSWLRLIIASVCLLAAFAGGYQLRVLIDEADAKVKLEAEVKAKNAAQASADAKAAAWEKQLAAMRDKNQKLQRRLANELKNAVYSSCVVPDSGVQLYNDALEGHAAGSANDSLP